MKIGGLLSQLHRQHNSHASDEEVYPARNSMDNFDFDSIECI